MEIFFIAGTFGALLMMVVILWSMYDMLQKFQQMIQDNFEQTQKTIRDIKFKKNKL